MEKTLGLVWIQKCVFVVLTFELEKAESFSVFVDPGLKLETALFGTGALTLFVFP
jgi:hypothetical protein